MSESKSGATDLLGIQPVAKALDRTLEATLAAAGAFLGRICLPAAEEFGLALKDRVSNYRAKNAAAVAIAAQSKLESAARDRNVQASPIVVHRILDQASWIEDCHVQDLWAGLLASSCSNTGDDSNLLFVTLLGSLTSLQARLISFACGHCRTGITPDGLLLAGPLSVERATLNRIAGTDDIHRLDREMDHLVSLGLLSNGLTGGGFSSDGGTSKANLTPSALCLQLYWRCQVSAPDPSQLFNPKPLGPNEYVWQDEDLRRHIGD